ncbi:MAG: protein kinase, partial [Myxococcaceae bacterium]|nr:protein kinase [Myxococcaceae bacterium]
MSSSDCLDPDTAASYVSNALTPDERAKVDGHIDGCANCRELVSLIAKSAWTTASGATLPAANRPSQEPTAANPGRRPPRVAGATLPRGTRVGSFEIRHPLSAGGMGVVYVAYDARLDRQLALKCVGDRHGDTQQLLNEARLMAQAAHPNVVPVYDVIDADGQLYIAMELVVGRTVGQWVAQAPHTWRQVVDVYLEAGKGLAAAHALGIVHGDVKPGNILVGDDGRVRVSDFGIASFASDADLLAGLIRGTPAYFAPEQRRGVPADYQSDQYAFAVSLHEALYGALPGSPPTRQVRLPYGLKRVLARALSETPGARYASMEELLRALRAVRLARGRLIAAAVSAVVVLLTVAFVFGGQRAEAARCAAAAAELKSPWSEDARARTRAAFERTQLSYAGDSFARTDAAIERWSKAFEGAVGEACTSPRANELLACLKGVSTDAQALITQLTAADVAMVLRAVAAAEGLPVAERCRAERAAPAAATGPAADAVRLELAKARAQAAAGRYNEAEGTARAAVAAAEATGDLGLIASAKADWGGDLTLISKYDEAAVVLGDAIRLAEVSHEDWARSHAWCDLLGAEYSRGHHDQVLQYGPAALGAAQRIDDVRHATEMMLTIGSSMGDKGRASEAKAMLEEAVKLREKAWGPNDRRT